MKNFQDFESTRCGYCGACYAVQKPTNTLERVSSLSLAQHDGRHDMVLVSPSNHGTDVLL